MFALMRNGQCHAALLGAALALGAARAPAAEPAHNDYTNPDSWLCRPGRADACAGDLTATAVAADGTRTRETFAADPSAPIDCFYIYPTVSREAAPNADMRLGPEEITAAVQQFARFGSKCRLYAPLYRQTTIAGLRAELRGGASGVDRAEPFNDVRDAFASYLVNDNGGRGFVLIGHSQGAGLLKNLIARHIEGTPAASRLVAAIIPGTSVDVPAGRDVGGTFQTIPLCGSAEHLGCVIAYSTYLASDPPGENARFGGGSKPEQSAACVNPAALDGKTMLDAYLPANGKGVADAGVDTPFIQMPGLFSAACVSSGERTYLSVSLASDARSATASAFLARVDRLPGWGLHVIDINLAIGNLVDLVGIKSAAWTARH